MADVKSSTGGARRDKARATRTAIIRAAHAEFIERGYAGATIASVAKRAKVATQTVYFVFHTKAALISAVIDAAVLGEDEVPPELTDWWRAMEAEPDAAESLRLFARGAAPLFERAAAISEVLRAAALTDDEVRATQDFHDDMQRTAYRVVIVGLEAKGRLRGGLDTDTATDVFLTVFGDSTYHLLRTERGWSHDQVVDWLADALPRLLLAE